MTAKYWQHFTIIRNHFFLLKRWWIRKYVLFLIFKMYWRLLYYHKVFHWRAHEARLSLQMMKYINYWHFGIPNGKANASHKWERNGRHSQPRQYWLSAGWVRCRVYQRLQCNQAILRWYVDRIVVCWSLWDERQGQKFLLFNLTVK